MDRIRDGVDILACDIDVLDDLKTVLRDGDVRGDLCGDLRGATPILKMNIPVCAASSRVLVHLLATNRPKPRATRPCGNLGAGS